MPLIQKLLVGMPLIFLGMLIFGATAVLAIAGLLVIRKYIPHHRLKVHNDVTGPIFCTVGVIYAVLLAFVAVMVWENYDRTKLNVEKEVECLVDLYRDSEGFKEEFKFPVRNLIKAYAQAIISKEWGSLVKGEGSADVEKMLHEFWVLYAGYSPEAGTEKVFFEESVDKLNELGELRLMRLIDSKNGLHPMLWLILIAGGLITILFAFIFGAENINAQIIMTVLLGLLISLIIFTVLLFNFPFSTEIGISPDVFKRVLALG